MKAILALIALAPLPSLAQDWEMLRDDTKITAVLAGQTVIYDAYTQQRFGPRGDTQYITERFSEGRWAARGGQYCSAWPPSELWTCYDFGVSGELVLFVAADGSLSQGRIKR